MLCYCICSLNSISASVISVSVRYTKLIDANKSLTRFMD